MRPRGSVAQSLSLVLCVSCQGVEDDAAFLEPAWHCPDFKHALQKPVPVWAMEQVLNLMVSRDRSQRDCIARTGQI